ncbi:hypothetical protein KKG58_04795 [Patescibacteria group bacterium]|nr:hypothetical protein [Patescibacteria group bacterium]
MEKQIEEKSINLKRDLKNTIVVALVTLVIIIALYFINLKTNFLVNLSDLIIKK